MNKKYKCSFRDKKGIKYTVYLNIDNRRVRLYAQSGEAFGYLPEVIEPLPGAQTHLMELWRKNHMKKISVVGYENIKEIEKCFASITILEDM